MAHRSSLEIKLARRVQVVLTALFGKREATGVKEKLERLYNYIIFINNSQWSQCVVQVLNKNSCEAANASSFSHFPRGNNYTNDRNLTCCKFPLFISLGVHDFLFSLAVDRNYRVSDSFDTVEYADYHLADRLMIKHANCHLVYSETCNWELQTLSSIQSKRWLNFANFHNEINAI